MADKIDPWYIQMKMTEVITDYQKRFKLPTDRQQYLRQIEAIKKCAKEVCGCGFAG